MKNTLIAVSSIIALLVIAFLTYDLMKGELSPCETIFEQTAVQLGAKMKIVKTEGEVFVGKEKIQSLSEAAQLTALNLKACCITLDAGKVSASQFLQCKDSARAYQAKVDAVIARVQEATDAKRSGKQDVVEAKVAEIDRAIEEAKGISDEFATPAVPSSKGVVSEKFAADSEQGTERSPSADGESLLRLVTILADNAEPVANDVYYNVYEAKQDMQGERRRVTGSGDPKPLFRLPEGRYVVQATHGNASTSAEVELKAGQRTDVTLNLNAGYVAASGTLAEDTEPLAGDLFYEVFEAERDLEGNRKELTYSGDAKPLFRLPEGRYIVQARHGDASASAEVEVKAGQRTDLTLNLNAGYVVAWSTLADGTDPIANDLYFDVYEAKQDIQGERKRVTGSGDAKPLFRLPEGQYVVQVRHGNASTSAEVEVKAGQRTDVTLNLNAGYVAASSTLAEDTEPLTGDLFYEVFEAERDLEGNRKELAYSGDAKPLFRLPEGRYIVQARHGDASASTEVEVKAGQRKDVTLRLAPP